MAIILIGNFNLSIRFFSEYLKFKVCASVPPQKCYICLSKHDFLKMEKIGNIKTLPKFRQIKKIFLKNFLLEKLENLLRPDPGLGHSFPLLVLNIRTINK